MFGKIINNKIVYAPSNYKLENGDLIVGFNSNELLMAQYGFKKIVGTEPFYDKNTECVVVNSFEETETEINVTYQVKSIGTLLKDNNLSQNELVDIIRKELICSTENLVDNKNFDSISSVLKYMFENFSSEEIFIGNEIPPDPKYKLWIQTESTIKDDDDDGKYETQPTPGEGNKPEFNEEDATNLFISSATVDSTIIGYYASSETTSSKYPDKNICLCSKSAYVGQYVKIKGTSKDVDNKIFKITGVISPKEAGTDSTKTIFAINCKDQSTASAIGEVNGTGLVGMAVSKTSQVAKVTTAALNVRKGIGATYDIIGTVQNGYTFPILETYNNTSWVMVYYNGSFGYINASSEYCEISTIKTDGNGNPIIGEASSSFVTPCYGVDLSKWDENLNFKEIKNKNEVQFAILRIGYGSRTGGNPILDTRFEEYLQGCINNNIPVGVFLFSYADSIEDVKKEANWVVNKINQYSQTFEFPIFFDQEYDSLNTVPSGSGYKSKNPGKTVLTNYINTFCEIINDAGYMAGVYGNPDWFTNYINFDDLKYKDHIWLAQWNDSFTWNKSDVKIWQMGTKTPAGFTQEVDYNKCFFDYPSYVRANHKNGF